MSEVRRQGKRQTREARERESKERNLNVTGVRHTAGEDGMCLNIHNTKARVADGQRHHPRPQREDEEERPLQHQKVRATNEAKEKLEGKLTTMLKCTCAMTQTLRPA